VVITTGLDATATKRPGGPIHESYWTVSAPVCRPSGLKIGKRRICCLRL